jgi:hypothetical protein
MIQPIDDGTPDAEVHYTDDDSPSQSCPASLTPTWHLIPFIQVGVRWNLNSSQFADALEGDGATYDLNDFYLASDFQGGSNPVANGPSAHTDFMSGWSPGTLDAAIPCLHVGYPANGLNCGYVVDGGST